MLHTRLKIRQNKNGFLFSFTKGKKKRHFVMKLWFGSPHIVFLAHCLCYFFCWVVSEYYYVNVQNFIKGDHALGSTYESHFNKVNNGEVNWSRVSSFYYSTQKPLSSLSVCCGWIVVSVRAVKGWSSAASRSSIPVTYEMFWLRSDLVAWRKWWRNFLGVSWGMYTQTVLHL